MADRRRPKGVRAAGGVVADAAGRVLVVHRPRYDDWSLPKGKLERGETWEDAALREVLEETGFRCALGPSAGEVSYEDHRGRPKVVRYWHVAVLDGSFQPNDEVDEIRWLPAADAVSLLTHEADRDLLAAATAT